MLTFALIILTLIITDQLMGVILEHITDEAPDLVEADGSNGSSGITYFWKLTSAGISPIVFMGDSEIQEGFDPEQFDNKVSATLGKPIHTVNLGIPGATTALTDNLLAELVLPRGVDTMMLGLEMRSLRTGPIQTQYFQEYQTSPLGSLLLDSRSPERSALLWLLEHSTFYRYRVNLRSWLAGQLVDPNLPIDMNGHMRLTVNSGRGLLPIKEQFVPFHPDPALTNALNDMAKRCRQINATCIFLNMPFHPDAYQVITPQDTQAYWAIVLETAKTYGIPIWDFDTDACHALFTDSLFYDVNHLNQQGADLLTDDLATLYIQQQINPSQPLRDNCAHIIQ